MCIEELKEATEYCLKEGHCVGCKFSQGKMFATCRYLVENMMELLKEQKIQIETLESLRRIEQKGY